MPPVTFQPRPQPQPQTAAGFEYKIIALVGHDPLNSGLEDKLNALGRQGWRLAHLHDRYLFLERENGPARRPAA